MSFSEKSEAARQQVLSPWKFKAYLWKNLPLGACSGMKLTQLDERSCTVWLPGGWRTQNPFASTYFAAQTMAAEMSTGAPAMVLTRGASASVAMILRDLKATFTKRIQGPSTFTFEDVAALKAVVDHAAANGESQSYTARSIGRSADGAVCSEFEVTWSFKRRS